MKKKVTYLIIILALAILLVFTIRFFSPKELDDVHPDFLCKEDLLEKSDILWVTPKFNGKSMEENMGWCEHILSLNKTLGLHGVYHSFNEFEQFQREEYLEGGIEIFEKCFGYSPIMFKPPQLQISEENKNLILENDLEIKGRLNQIFHKVYHCDDSGIFPNWFIDFF